MQVTSNCSVSSTRIDLSLPFVLERPSTFGTETAGKPTGHFSITRAYRRSKQARSAIKEAAGTLVASRKPFTPSVPRLGSVKHSYLVHSWVDQPHSATQRQHTTYEPMLEIPSGHGLGPTTSHINSGGDTLPETRVEGSPRLPRRNVVYL